MSTSRPRRRRLWAGAMAAGVALAVLPALPAGAEARDITRACPEGEVPASGFTDIADLAEGHQAAVDCIVSFGIAHGTTETTYSPAATVTRGQMASFLGRLLGVAAPDQVPEDPPDAFTDDDGTTHEASIDVVAALGVALGTGPGSFSPGSTVTRAQMASFVARAIGVATGAEVAPDAPDAFTDDDGTTHEANIDSLAALGIVQGTAPGRYEPAAAVTRAQMALFLARTLGHLAEQGLLGPAGGALQVAGEHELREVGANRTCTVTAPTDTTVHLRVLRTADVATAGDGTLRFADVSPADGLADTVPVAPSITSVDGTSQPADTRAVDDVTSDGEITVTLGAAGEGEVVLVVFADGDVGTAKALDIDPDGAPVDDAGAGCATAFVPPEAVQGIRADVIVNTVGADGTYFTGAPQGGSQATYVVDDADEAAGKATSVEGLRALLSAGDVLDVDYDPTPDGPSTFDVNVDTVKGTSKPTVVPVDDSADGTVDDVRVAFVTPLHNGAGTVYRITRVATHANTAGDCTSSIAATGTTVGTTDASPFVDVRVPEGCWIYRTVAASPTGATAISNFSDPVETPGEPPDTVRPRSIYASVTDDGDGLLDPGDVIHLVFDETMDAPAAGATLTVTESGQSVTFTAGSDATFTRVEVASTVGPTERPPRTVIEVRPTSAPSASLTHPTTVTAATGITDVTDNRWDIAQSPDRTLEVES